MARRDWTDRERYAALKLYFELEFGQFHSKNRQIIALADALERTPSAVAMKLCNFASLDPTLHRAGLKGASAADRNLMTRFHNQPERVVDEIERATDSLNLPDIEVPHIVHPFEQGRGVSEGAMSFDVSGRPTEVSRTRKERLNQGFFRRAVISGYRFRCCVCGGQLHRLLEASHIKPHKEDQTYRLRPDNGLSLCRNHHAAFDEGYWTLTHQLRIEVDPQLEKISPHDPMIKAWFLRFDGDEIHKPFRYLPSLEAIDWHRENTFAKKFPAFGHKQPI